MNQTIAEKKWKILIDKKFDIFIRFILFYLWS